MDIFSANIIPLQIGYGIKREKSKMTLRLGGLSTERLELPFTVTGKTEGGAGRVMGASWSWVSVICNQES